jgi:hypothetical protein
LKKLNKSKEQSSTGTIELDPIHLKEKVAPVGIVKYDNTISPDSESTAKEYFVKYCVDDNYNFDHFLKDIKLAVGEAKALHCLKQQNQKSPLKKNIDLVVKHAEKLSEALKAVANDHYTLSLLRREIDYENDVIGYQKYKKLIEPASYAHEELDILVPLLRKVQDTVKEASELKTTDWQLLLCVGLIRVETKLTGLIPPITSSSGTNILPPIYNFINSVSLNELGQGTSEEKVKQALKIKLPISN